MKDSQFPWFFMKCRLKLKGFCLWSMGIKKICNIWCKGICFWWEFKFGPKFALFIKTHLTKGFYVSTSSVEDGGVKTQGQPKAPAELAVAVLMMSSYWTAAGGAVCPWLKCCSMACDCLCIRVLQRLWKDGFKRFIWEPEVSKSIPKRDLHRVHEKLCMHFKFLHQNLYFSFISHMCMSVYTPVSSVYTCMHMHVCLCI